MVRTVLIYGLILALGAFALQWMQYQFWARSHAVELWVGLVAAGFLALGVWIGGWALRPGTASAFAPNETAAEQLGLTRREREVLGLLAAGRSNKEIARQLGLSPNTVKTHIARLYDKLQAVRRTDAVLRARELHLIP
jgi:NarL family two-component system response regulator LiaR